MKMDMRKNIQNNTRKNTNTSTQKATYDAERMKRWTEPLPYFEGKAPTSDELTHINKIKAYLETIDIL
jgi:hypothetical protein